MAGKEYKAPQEYSPFGGPYVFLAGSIEIGKATKWQDHASAKLLEMGFSVLNPRRDDWDSSWVQDISNPQFVQQVNWELDSIDCADLVLMYFEPGTMSPITLLELGALYGFGDKTVYIVCPEGFWRRGDVQVVASRHPAFFMCDTIDQALSEIWDNFRDSLGW